MNQLTTRIVDAEGVQTSPNRRPRDAATLVVIDRSDAIPKVMFGKRHHAHAFLPGKFVFPGGRVERQDRFVRAYRALHPQVEAKLMQRVAAPSKTMASALALAAIRETFEETGLLIGTRRGDWTSVPAGPWREFARHGILPDLSVLHFIARAITPPRYPRRFDTRFFTVDASAIAHQVEDTVSADAELIELVWLPITQLRRIDMPVITCLVLQELETRVAAGFGPDLPIPFYRMKHKRFIRETI